MKLFLIITIAVFGLSNASWAQDFGFNGKKNIISVFTTSNLRVTPALVGFMADDMFDNFRYRTDTYDAQDNYKRKRDFFRVDYRLSYQRILSQRFALGAEFAYGKTTARMYGGNYGYYDNLGYYVEYPESISDPIFRTYSFMITGEIYKPTSISGAGFSIGFGLGPKFYSFDYDQNYRFSENDEMINPYSLTESNLVAINFFYQLSYRLPLTKSIFLETGIRFHSGIVFPVDGVLTGPSNNSYWSKADMFIGLFGDNFLNLTSLKTGFVFEF
ncbi:MAG: hypothetical protein COA33_006590 [Fluviicola sp.]|nr:hypothetical protein [Fluviicola sp.]